MPEAEDAATVAAAAATAAAEAAATAAAETAATTATDEAPEAKIARLEGEVKAARAEAGKSRVNAKETAAAEARAEMAKEIGKALGLIADETPDPAKLLEQATAAQASAKQAQVELGVYRAASAAGADASALLDSRAFLAQVASIEPSDTAALTAAITEAMAANPRLAASATPAGPEGMRPNPAQGGSGNGPLSLAAQIAAAEQGGDLRSVMRLKAAQGLAQG